MTQSDTTIKKEENMLRIKQLSPEEAQKIAHPDPNEG